MMQRILSQVLMYTHIMNCIWITIGKFNDGTISWIQTIIPEDGEISEYLRRIYVSGIYYILTTISTVGYGDISCATLTEMLYSCVCMFFGIALFAYIQGGLVDAIKESLLSGEIKDSKHQEEFQTWLIEREQNISNPLSHKKLKQMRECTQFKFKYEFSTNIFETEYFEYLPPYEQSALFLFYFSDITTLYSTFFRNISEVSVIQSIIACFKPVYVPKNGIVSYYQEKSKGIYFIFKGKVIIEQVYYNKQTYKLNIIPFRELTQGSFFGENCLIDKQSKVNFKVSEEEDLYCFFIKKEKLFNICEKFPYILQQLMKLSHFRNKFFKIEGERTAEKQNIFNTIKSQQRDTLNIQNNVRDKSDSRTQSLYNPDFKDLTGSTQYNNDEKEVSKKNAKKERFDLLNEIQQSSDQQNLQIFKKLQDENLIVNLYQQIIQLTHQLQLPMRNADKKQQGPIEFVKDIFQEQFEEECSEKKNTKQTNLRNPKANILSDIGKLTEKDASDLSLNNFQLIQSKLQMSQSPDLQEIISVNVKNNQNNSPTQISNGNKMRSLQNSSEIGAQSLHRSRLSLIKEKDQEFKQKLNNNLIRSSSLKGRRNGILQSQYRENNQQNVHKKSSSEQYNHFQFVSQENNSQYQNDDNIISNLLYSIKQNSVCIETKKSSILNDIPFQKKNYINDDEDCDGQITNDIKFSQIRLNKKEDIQNSTTNTQIFTNALLTLNTERDQLLTESNKQKIGSNHHKNELDDFQFNYERNLIIKSNDAQQINKNNKILNQDEDFFMEQQLEFEENKTNAQANIQQQSTQKEKKFLKQLNQNEGLLFQDFYSDALYIENNRSNQHENLLNSDTNLNNKNYDEQNELYINEQVLNNKNDKQYIKQNKDIHNKQGLISQYDKIKEQDLIEENDIFQIKNSPNKLQNIYHERKRKNSEQIIDLLISQDKDQVDLESQKIHQNSNQIAYIQKKNEHKNNQNYTAFQKNINKQSIFNGNNTNGEHFQNYGQNLQALSKYKLDEEVKTPNGENKEQQNFFTSDLPGETLQTQEIQNQQFNGQNLITLTQGEEDQHLFFPALQQNKENTNNKSMHIPTEPSDYFNILEEKQISDIPKFHQTFSGQPKKSHKERFLLKNYFEESRRKSINQKKKFQEQLEQIVNEAELESSRRTISINTAIDNQQLDEQIHLRNQSSNPYQYSLNQSQTSYDSKNNMIDLQSNYSIGQSNLIDLKPLKKESMDSTDSKRYSNTIKAQEAKRRKVSGYLDQSLISSLTNQVKSVSQYINKDEKKKSQHLYNFFALIKIIQLDKRFKKGKDVENTQQGQQNLETSAANNKQTEHTQENHDKSQAPSISQNMEIYIHDDENEFQDNILDNSIDVPIEIIEPSFTREEFDSTIPYLNLNIFNQNQIQRLENRFESVIKQVSEFSKFCEEKMEQIKIIKQRRSKPKNKDSSKQQMLMNFQKINLK